MRGVSVVADVGEVVAQLDSIQAKPIADMRTKSGVFCITVSVTGVIVSNTAFGITRRSARCLVDSVEFGDT